MESRLTGSVCIFPDADALASAAARALVESFSTNAAVVGRRSLVLAGGNTPRALYRLLGEEYRDAVTWENVRFFWGDERYVPKDDPRSNFRMAKEAWLDSIGIPSEHVYPMPTDLPDPDAAAWRYEATLRAHFPATWPRFDVVLLGLGADGHTASLFPDSPALEERDRWVVAVRAPVEPPVRLTLTLPAINHAAVVWFLVSGADKAEALRHTLAGDAAEQRRPAAEVRLSGGEPIWWVDRAAAALLPRPRRTREVPRG